MFPDLKCPAFLSFGHWPAALEPAWDRQVIERLCRTDFGGEIAGDGQPFHLQEKRLVGNGGLFDNVVFLCVVHRSELIGLSLPFE